MVAAADVEGDGDQDLVSANAGGDDLTVFWQLSPGTFATVPLVLGGPGTTSEPVFVAVADLDGDDDLDLVSANVDGDDVTVFVQLSPKSFAADPLVLGDSATTDFPRSIAAADLDGDGDQDLASANAFGDNLAVFEQLSPGRFTADPLVLGALGGVIPQHASVAAADLDGDGDLDLVSTKEFGNRLTIFEQLSPGSFAADPHLVESDGRPDAPASVAAADLDGDGDQDLVSANGALGSDDGLTVFLQLSPGSFSGDPLVLGGLETTLDPVSVAVADLDGDGDGDLVSANSAASGGDSNLTVFLQLSPGGFAASPQVLGGHGAAFGPATSVAAADLDGDGDLDLVSSNRSGDSLTVFEQLSPGSFADSPLVLGDPDTILGANSVAAGDVDGDGDQDLVSASLGFPTRNKLTVFMQHAPGSFAVAPLVLGGTGTTDGAVSVATADLDGDGDQDLVSANGGARGRNNLTVFMQHSPGSFAAAPLVLGSPGTTTGAVSVAAADLDGDGDQDLVSANLLGFPLTVFFGGR